MIQLTAHGFGTENIFFISLGNGCHGISNKIFSKCHFLDFGIYACPIKHYLVHTFLFLACHINKLWLANNSIWSDLEYYIVCFHGNLTALVDIANFNFIKIFLSWYWKWHPLLILLCISHLLDPLPVILETF